MPALYIYVPNANMWCMCCAVDTTAIYTRHEMVNNKEISARTKPKQHTTMEICADIQMYTRGAHNRGRESGAGISATEWLSNRQRQREYTDSAVAVYRLARMRVCACSFSWIHFSASFQRCGKLVCVSWMRATKRQPQKKDFNSNYFFSLRLNWASPNFKCRAPYFLCSLFSRFCYLPFTVPFNGTNWV